MMPKDFKTVQSLRDAIMNGEATVFKALIVAVRVNGLVIAEDQYRGRAGDITYDILPIDTDELFAPESLENVSPHNRRADSSAIWASRVNDLADFVRLGNAIQPELMRYDLYALTEYPAFVSCDGEWID